MIIRSCEMRDVSALVASLRSIAEGQCLQRPNESDAWRVLRDALIQAEREIRALEIADRRIASLQLEPISLALDGA